MQNRTKVFFVGSTLSAVFSLPLLHLEFRFTIHRSRSTQLPTSITTPHSQYEISRNKIQAFRMAEAFLYELLQMHNSVHTPEERCSICLEEYGTLSRETGTIEVEIRLPCKHTIGSACIAIWLKTNNTCPICRHEFFPAQPRPYLEHGIMDDEEDEDVDVDEDMDEDVDEDVDRGNEDDQQNLGQLMDDYCAQLGLGRAICVLSCSIFPRLIDSPNLNQGHTDLCMVAVSIYMASHIKREPRSPREVAAVTGIPADHIRFTYDLIYPERRRVVPRYILYAMNTTSDNLNWPAPGHELTDDQIEHDHMRQILREGCEDGCHELGLEVRVAEITYRIAEYLCNHGYMAHLSPRSLTAVSIFMASHITCCPVTTARIADVVRINEHVVQSAYSLVHLSRRTLGEEGWLGEYGRGNMESILQRLPSPSAFS